MTYELDINRRAFNAIKNKTKRIEVRATKLEKDSFDYKVLKENDIIDFTSDSEHLLVRITDINHYNTIEELLVMEGTRYTLSSTNDFNKGVKSINSLDGYKEAIKKWRLCNALRSNLWVTERTI